MTNYVKLLNGEEYELRCDTGGWYWFSEDDAKGDCSKTYLSVNENKINEAFFIEL